MPRSPLYCRKRTAAAGRLAGERLERRDCPAAVLSIALNEPVVVEGEPVVCTLRLSQPSTVVERIFVTTADITATYGTDYFAPVSQQVVFAPGQTVRTVSISTLRDAGRPLAEGSETFRVTATPTTASLGTRTAVATIADYVPPPAISVQDIAVAEGNSGTTSATFTVALSSRYPRAVTVNYATRDLTATAAGQDYVPATGTLTFAAGETSKTVAVTVNGDAVLESNETFSLVLSSPANATLGRATGVCTITNDEIDQSGFQITVVFTSPVSTSQRAAFGAAAARWSQVITGDLPSVTLPSGTFIDDVSIDASIVAIDGVGGVLGQAGPDALRPGNGGLPYTGGMQFDTADVAALEANGTFQAVILHEMGHVLGIGSLWSLLGLVTGAGGNNPVFTGTNAVREYNAIFGVTGTSVPVENTGGPGTRDSHWREATMRTELMTGFAEPGGVAMPISRITVGSLADIGYTVNYAAADPYSRPQAIAPGTPPGRPQTPIHANPSPTPPTPVPTPTPPSTPKTPPKNPAPNPVPPGEQKPPAKSLGTISPGTIERPAAKPIANAMRAAAFAALAPR